MIIVAVIEAVALVAVVYLLLRQQSERATAYERLIASLADRIQHPERPSVTDAPEFSWPPDDEEPDEIELVGTIAEPKDEQ